MKEFKPSAREVSEILDRWYDLELKRQRKEQKHQRTEVVPQEIEPKVLRAVASLAITTNPSVIDTPSVPPVVEAYEPHDTKLIHVYDEIRKYPVST